LGFNLFKAPGGLLEKNFKFLVWGPNFFGRVPVPHGFKKGVVRNPVFFHFLCTPKILLEKRGIILKLLCGEKTPFKNCGFRERGPIEIFWAAH